MLACAKNLLANSEKQGEADRMAYNKHIVYTPIKTVKASCELSMQFSK